MDCTFCKIIKGEIPATVIYEDDKVIAFDDIHPKAPIHKLIVPKQHIATLNDISEKDKELVGHMLFVVKEVAKQLNVADHGYRTVINTNAGGGQVIFHVHAHLLARPQKQYSP